MKEGTMRAFADKLIDILERHTEEVARQWSKAVRSNPRTPFYHTLSEAEYVQWGISFYENLRKLYFSARPYPEVDEFFSRLGREMFDKGIPLEEAVYTLILLRRHIWLFADFNVVFVTTLDMHQAVESINRTIQMFDQGIFVVTRKYGELAKSR
jgi:hypothetical protein